MFSVPISSQLKACIVIPVKDEEENLIPCLDALRNQKNNCNQNLSFLNYEVLVLANNCQDNSFSLVQKYQQHYADFHLWVEKIQFSEDDANIGNARTLLMNIAYERLMKVNPENGIIVSTDGDTCVDQHWLYNIEQEMARGCDVVGGNIITDVQDDFILPYHLDDLIYQNLIVQINSLINPQVYNPWPSHFQCFGASLAIRATIYHSVGGIPKVRYLEDVALIEALELVDAKIRRSPAVKVYTSARKTGRVEKGLSQQMAWFESLGMNGQQRYVESAESVIFKTNLRKFLFDVWNNQALHTSPIPLKTKTLERWSKKYPYFGGFQQKVMQELEALQWFQQWPETDIQQAIKSLEIYLKKIHTISAK